MYYMGRWAKPGLFLVYFCSFSQHKDKYSTNFTINDKSIDGVLGSRTRGGMMEGTDKSTEIFEKSYCDKFSCKSRKMTFCPILKNITLEVKTALAT